MAKQRAKKAVRKSEKRAKAAKPGQKKKAVASKKAPGPKKGKAVARAKTKLNRVTAGKKPAMKPQPAAFAKQRQKTLLCRLDHRAPGWVEMAWEDVDSGKSWAYKVDREALRRLAAEIRGDAIDRERRADRRVGKLELLERINSRFSSESAEYRDALHALARVGADLHRAALGEGVGRKDPGGSDPKPFRDWFNANVVSAPRGAWRIVMIHKNLDSAVIPWGLAFAPPREKSGDEKHIEDLPISHDGLGGFWCIAFALSVVGLRYTHNNATPIKLVANQTKMGVVIEVGETAVDAYTREDHNYAREDEELVLNSKTKFITHARRFCEQNNFFYISLNAQGGAYRLTNDMFEGEDLASHTERIERMVFAMLDGDCVIRGDRGAEWVKDLLMSPNRGVFAVETDVSSPQQRFFGWTFMRDALITGRPLSEGVAEARLKHWPRSLLYGLYCTPMQAAMAPPDDFAASIKIVDGIIDQHVAELKRKAKS